MKTKFLFTIICVVSLGLMSFKSNNTEIQEYASFEKSNFEIVILEEVRNADDCGVGCTATATNSETGESVSFYSYVIASNCGTAANIACGQAYAQALNYIENHR